MLGVRRAHLSGDLDDEAPPEMPASLMAVATMSFLLTHFVRKNCWHTAQLLMAEQLNTQAQQPWSGSSLPAAQVLLSLPAE